MKLSLHKVITYAARTALVCMVACGAAQAIEPNSAEVMITVVQAGNCYAQAHSLDAGKSQRQEAFDKCACEAGHCHD